MRVTSFAPPRDVVLLESDDPCIVALAGKLWERTDGSTAHRNAIRLRVTLRPGPAPGSLPERDLSWDHGEELFTLSHPHLLTVRIHLRDALIEAEASDRLLGAAPSFAARYLLEAPAAVLFTRRAFTVLHAGAVVGANGAVVLRGAAGAGKSTLVAAAWRAGLCVLADESLLVAREDPDELAAAVRDLALQPDAARLLALDGAAEPAFCGGEEKRRIDLFAGSNPAVRRARRAATLLLGPRSPGPARLVSLEPRAFEAEFRMGEIPQERLGDPEAIARSWGAQRSWRLDGAVDLAGAVAILRSLSEAA